MQTDTITWGETYDISVTVKDADGLTIALDDTYQAACRVTREVSGATLIDVPVVIADGMVKASIDTGDNPWKAATYYYDIRITDPDGHDYWSEPVRLTLNPRNTPNT
jgi:hypothetical protein